MLALAACSGGGSTGTIPSSGGGAGPTIQTADATLTITIPRDTGTSSSSRGAESLRPSYVSSNTQSMTIAINGGTPLDFTLTNSSPGCSGTGSSTTCTIAVAAPVGTSESWAFTLYATTNETGTPLSVYTENGITIAAGVANNLGPYTLNPVVGSYSVAWNTRSFTADSNSTGSIYLTVKDPSGATIISPGAYETSAGATVTFSLSDNLPNSAPFNDTSWSYALSFASGSSTQPAASAPSNQIDVAYGGLSLPATNFYVNDDQGIQASNATFVSQAAVLGAPALVLTCQEAGDTCGSASASFINGGDTATITPSEPGWTDSPFDQSFSTSADTCTGGSAGSTLSASSPTWTLTANTGDNPGSCSVTFKDSATLGQTLTANATYTYTTVTVDGHVRP